MDIENFGETPSAKPTHHPMLPDDIRMLIVGQSGCGKTNLVVNLIIKYVSWFRLYVITTTPYQAIYDNLRDLPHAASSAKGSGSVIFYEPEEVDAAIFDEMPPMSLVIFDDYMMQKDQTLPRIVFSRGRHRSVNSIYISQKFTETDLVIRQNANVLVMFNVDKKSRECVHNMYASADMELADFKKIKLARREFLAILRDADRKKKFYLNFKKAL